MFSRQLQIAIAIGIDNDDWSGLVARSHGEGFVLIAVDVLDY